MLSMLNAVNTALYVWIAVLGVVVILIAIFIGIVPIGVWIKAMVSGAHISAIRLIGMKLRHIEVGMVVDIYINAKKAGVQLTIYDIEKHYMAGGNVERVVDALITAHGAKIDLSVETAKAIDLANRDILAAVKQSVNPVVITTPEISAVAKDGIELRVKARVTVQSNINKLIGGAGEDTIIARVGEGIVTTVGSSISHEDVLENPDLISKTVLDKGLDSGTAFTILSIDIADIDVGRNIDAELNIAKAEAEKRIAQAKAEERKSMAIAAENEMKARVQEMRANLLNAESEVPRAISTAFTNGQIGVMDYYKMQNILADTNMRNSLGASERGSKKQKTDKE